jgi:hypothetical protein
MAGCGSSGPSFTSTTTLTSSATYAVAGSSPAITLTATVKGVSPAGSAAPAPTGTVGFLAGSTVVGAVELNGNSTVSTSVDPAKFPLGNNNVTAVYDGDSHFTSSTSPAIPIQVQTNTTLALIASPDSVQQGLTGYMIATVTRAAGKGVAGGNVSFSQNGTTLGTAALDNTGTAAFPLLTAQLPLAAYPVSAIYPGDAGDLASNGASATVTITPAVDVLTQRNNVQRTGVQPAETTLTPANVNANSFGKVFSFPLDGSAYAQPLYVSNYKMNDGNLHNVLFVETSVGSVYAFDADNNNPAAGYLWHISVIPSGEQVVGPNDVSCQDTQPNTTLIGTPVIDRTRGVIYLVSKTQTGSSNGPVFIQRIHALNLADGTEKLNGPTVITASVPGTGDGSVNGTVTFNPLTQNQRAALVEASGSVWISWASHCDNPPYHGWTIGYNASDVSKQTAFYNNTPNGSNGGIWMTGGGIATDNLGNLYTAAGNGTFDVNSGGPDYGDSLQRLKIGANSLTPADWFVPSNQSYLEDDDFDFGTVAPVLFDDPGSSVPHLVVTSDKTGRVYLVNRDDMGSYDTGHNGVNSLNGDLQDFASYGTLFNSYGYFNQRLYVGAGTAALVAYDYNPGTANSAGYLDSAPSMSTPQAFGGNYSTGGTQPVFSANGASNAILWGQGNLNNTTTLYAADPANLSNILYSSNTNPTRDQPPGFVKFAHPIIANGRVYVAGQGSVAVYGLLP